jgi:hypothetical protein
MADKQIKVKIDVETNTEGSIAELKALKKQLKETAAGSDEFKKIYNQIDDLEDKIKSAKGVSADWIDTLESAGGPIGALGKGLNSLKVSTQSFGAALKATGIGLVVAAVGGLVAAFTQVDGATKKLEPLMIALQKILGGIFEALTPLIDGFVDLATKALPYITTGIKVFYSSLVALFTLVKEGGAGVGKILKGIFTLDTDAIKEGYKQLTGTWTKTVEAFDASVERFDKGYAKKTKIEKENAKNAKEIADKALAEKLKIMEAEDKLDEARLEKLKAEALALATTEQQKLDVEKAFAEKSYQLTKTELEDKQKLYKKGTAEYTALQADIEKLDADNINKKTEFKDKQKTLDETALKDIKEFNKRATDIKTQAILNELEQTKKAREDKYKEDLAALELDKVFITKSEDEKQELRVALKAGFDQDNIKLEADAQAKQHDLKLRGLELESQGLVEGTMSYFANKKAILDENYAKELDANKAQYNQGLIDLDEFEKNKAIIEGKYVKQSTDLQKAKFDQYLQYATQVLGALSSTLSQASSVMKMQQEEDIKNAEGNTEKIEEIKKKAFEDNKKMQIAQAIIGTLQSAVQAYQSLAVIPVVGPFLGAAAAAAALVFGYKQVALIKAQKYQSSGGTASAASVGGSPAVAPTAPSVVGIQAPQIQTGEGSNPTTQLGQTLTSAQKPLRAYVVSQDIQSQTALDRRTNRAATFSGG